MLKKKCTACGKKTERKYNYCPYCGDSFKVSKDKEDYGFLGREDGEDFIQEFQNLPFGMDKLVNSLVKQLEKELNEASKNGFNEHPRGIRINVSTSKPQIKQVLKETDSVKERLNQSNRISQEEMQRRISLPKVNAESKVKRLSDKIIYEINVPGVINKEDITITKLATGLEIRAYSGSRCYVKFIPLTVEVIRYAVKDEKIYIELKV